MANTMTATLSLRASSKWTTLDPDVRALIDAQAAQLISRPPPVMLHCVTTPLHDAAKAGDLALVRELAATISVDSTADPDLDYMYTPLLFAVRNRHTDVAMFLIDAGANVNAESEWFRTTALMLAAAHGNATLVHALLAAGANVNAKCDDMMTPLTYAVIYGHEAIVNDLLAAGAEVNIRCAETKPLTTTYYGSKLSNLMIAAHRGHEGIVKALLAAGADVSAVSHPAYNDTALSLAKTDAIREHLRAAGATA